MAPTIDARKLADWPEWYQPAALPTAVAITDPAMPMTAVTIRPVGCFPGTASRAMKPTISPTMMASTIHTRGAYSRRAASVPGRGDPRRLGQRPHDDAVALRAAAQAFELLP